MNESELTRQHEAMLQIDDAARQVEADRFSMLRELGWEYTQQTPTYLWMWQKRLRDGRTVVVHLADAWLMAWREMETAVATEHAEHQSKVE